MSRTVVEASFEKDGRLDEQIQKNTIGKPKQ